MDPVLVVGAAVVREGRVLATRRTRPPETAGRWELPGGKVEPGESPARAVEREVREELGCTVRAESELDGEQPIGDRAVLRVLRCRLVEGDPRPGEHDALRWLAPEELDEVDWLAPDRPFVAQLHDLLLDADRLAGGNVGEVVRVGRTVRRGTGPWTPAVHRLLDQVRARGLRAVPEVLGEDARAREVLTYLDGTIVDVDSELLGDAQLTDLARWARELHDVTADLDHGPGSGPWRWPPHPGATVIGHTDLAPYNVCWDGDRLAGVFDWDLVCPTTPLLELAHLAWTCVPLFSDRPADEVARRLRLVAAAYDGGIDALTLLRAVPGRVRLSNDGIRAWIARGDPGGLSLAAVGEPERTERAMAAMLRRMPTVERALAAAE